MVVLGEGSVDPVLLNLPNAAPFNPVLMLW